VIHFTAWRRTSQYAFGAARSITSHLLNFEKSGSTFVNQKGRCNAPSIVVEINKKLNQA